MFFSRTRISTRTRFRLIEHDNKSGPISSRVRYVSDRIPGCLSFSGIPGPIFSTRTRIITRTRLLYFGHELKSGPNCSSRVRFKLFGPDFTTIRVRFLIGSGKLIGSDFSVKSDSIVFQEERERRVTMGLTDRHRTA